MNKKLLIAVFVSAMAHTFACAASPKENRMKTVWADKVTSENVWQSYPRPQLQRSQWMNLNGLWQYAVTTQDTPKKEVKKELPKTGTAESSAFSVLVGFLLLAASVFLYRTKKVD